MPAPLALPRLYGNPAIPQDPRHANWKVPAVPVELKEGVIAAKRHIHTTPEDAEKLGVKDKEIVNVKVESNGRSLIFGDVVVRVSPKFATAMHIDTDESNAAGLSGEVYGEIVK